MREDRTKRWMKYVVVTLTLAIALAGSFKYVSGFASVSSNVNGRELPIYCVETDEKKVALSFDKNTYKTSKKTEKTINE